MSKFHILFELLFVSLFLPPNFLFSPLFSSFCLRRLRPSVPGVYCKRPTSSPVLKRLSTPLCPTIRPNVNAALECFTTVGF